MKNQIGQFFMVVGLIVLAVFCATTHANSPVYPICIGGLAIFAFGSYLFWRGYSAPPPSERFRMLRNRKKKQ